MTRLIAKKAFQDILRQMRGINRDTKSSGSDAAFVIEKDSMGGYTVTVPQSGHTVLKGLPGSNGYLCTFDEKLFAN